MLTLLWAILLVLGLLFFLLLTVLGLPGNWLMVGATAVYAYFVVEPSWRIGWPIVVVLLVLASVGELVEFLASAVGVAKAGGSRRSSALALVGSIVGAICGAIVGIPIPIVGSLLAAVLGASIGAFLGAMAGEDWDGRDREHSVRVGWAAFWSRMVGTVAKTTIGAMMFVVALIGLFAV